MSNAVDTVLKIAKEAGEMFKDVPYVKALVGIILQIVQIREEIQMEKDRCQELIDKILRRSKVILDGLLRVAASPSKDRLGDIEGKLGEYNDLLGGTLTVLKRHASKSLSHRIFNRTSRLGDLEKYNRLVDDFNADFVTDLHIQSHLMIAQRTMQPPATTDIAFYKPVLPPPPEFLFGRDREKSDIIDLLANKRPARIAILGAGGIGKTTLALSALHDPLVANRYPSRFFVSCEAAPSVSTLLWEIANTLRIPPARRDEHLIDLILSSFPKDTVLCLDNFEATLDNEPSRSDVEDILSHLSHVPELAIIVTMRGTQRPSRVSWSKPLLPPLRKLDEGSSRQIFEVICGEVDEFVEKLLRDVDGMPLAVTLVSSLLRDASETSRSLWARWEKMQTSVIEDGGKGRLSNLDTSIALSVYGPCMQADPNARSVLTMLSILPDGLPHNEDILDDLQSDLPKDVRLDDALVALQRVSLVYIDETHKSHRVRILSPIRHFCQKRLKVSDTLIDALISFYAKLINKFPDVTNEASHAIIPPELSNMHTVFIQAYRFERVDHCVVEGSIQYTIWSHYVGNPIEDVMCLAIQKVTDPRLLARCHLTLSYVYVRECKLDVAETSLRCAVELHKQTYDIHGEAYDVQKLGSVYLQQDKLDEAETSLKYAIKLHKQIHDVFGEAHDVQMLGDVHLRQNKLNEAETSLKYAIELHKQTHDILGEAYAVQKLGDVYLQQSKLDDAETYLKYAIEIHKKAHDVLGEANDVQSLGDVYFQQDKLDEAETSFKSALELHKQTHSVLGEAYDVQSLGDVYLQQNKLVEAEISFKHAIELHKQMHDILGEANDSQSLGDVYLRQNKLDEAKISLKHAIELHKQAHDVLGEANDVQSLGDVYLRQYKLDEAETFFKLAIELHKQTHSALGEANDVQLLGDVYLQQNRSDEAEMALKYAIELHKQTSSIFGEANDVQLLGDVYLRQNKSDEAEASLKYAIELHKQIHSVLGEANDAQSLGDVYLHQNKLEEAETTLIYAIRLHKQAHDVFGEANDVQKLGNVYLQQNKLRKAETSLKHAIELHKQTQSVFGEANDVQFLGDVYLQQNKPDEAEESLKHAVELHKQVHSVLGEANDFQLLGDVYLHRGKLDEAETHLKYAIELHKQANYALGEANDAQKLGDVYLQQNKLHEAEASLKHAIELHRQTHSLSDEANDVQKLRYVYLQQSKLGIAEISPDNSIHPEIK